MATPAAKSGVHTSTEVPHKGPEASFPPFDQTTFSAQLIWLAITFGFLYVALSKFLLPRITDVIDARQDGIRRDLSKAEELKVETEKALADYEKALADAKNKAGDIAKTTRDGLAAEIDKERHKVEAEITQRVTTAEKRIAESKSKAMSSVNDIAGETVAAIVSKLTGSNISNDDAAKAIAAIRGK